MIGGVWCCVHWRRKAAQAAGEGEEGAAASVGLNGTLVDPHR
jgi:hypothetical protein